jgi:aldehyde dehydrogenase (NAD+)
MNQDMEIKIRQMMSDLGIEKLNHGADNGLEKLSSRGKVLDSYSPADGRYIASVTQANAEDYEAIMVQAQQAFLQWRVIPAPQRAEVVRLIGQELRKYKDELGMLVSYEMGKIFEEGKGEVQEMIDICDFAVGQARLMNGINMNSERPMHRMMEQYHPRGIVAVITSFNFPVAVWAWNAMLAMVCGDVILWKPSSKTPLCAVAVQNIIRKVLIDNKVPAGVLSMIVGSGKEIGDRILEDKRIPLVSATGSTAVGRRVGAKVGERLGRTILELGGNNAIIITENANLDMALRATIFGAVGTAGQRCTSTRRLIVHESVYAEMKERLVKVYQQLGSKIGHPLAAGTLVGPLIDQLAVDAFLNAAKKVVEEGGTLLSGGHSVSLADGGHYVMPAIAEAQNHFHIVQEETFAPILYIMKYKTLDEAIALHNGVPQGLSSAIFSQNILEAEYFLCASGSDCGIANINIGTSGAEIGGAFGGEKETGGGRESGSDAWKIYMRRQTNTVNYGTQMPLAQGISFEI